MNEKEIDFEHLTKEQTIYLHRKLWSSVAKLTHQLRRPVEKHEIFEIYGWPEISGYCWCCEYGKQQYSIGCVGPCTRCPIKWSDKNKGCLSYGSPYDEWNTKMMMWSKRKDFSKTEIKELSDLARQIANLPEKG